MHSYSKDRIASYLEFLSHIRPTSILDIGPRKGSLAFIARSFIDGYLDGNIDRKSWKITVDGIETCNCAPSAHQQVVYNRILIGNPDIQIDRLGYYDLLVVEEVLESFTRKKARFFIDKCFAHATKAIVVIIHNKKRTKDKLFPYHAEAKSSHWSDEDFNFLDCRIKNNVNNINKSGIFLILKEDYMEYRSDFLEVRQYEAANPVDNDSIRRRYGLSRAAISAIDLTPLSCHTRDSRNRAFFLNRNFEEHYQLLAYLSTRFTGSVIFDVGTNLGYSALALSYNSANTVISYDIIDQNELNSPEDLINIRFVLGNVLEDPQLSKASLILLDTFHQGDFECGFYRHLEKIQFNGLLIIDDIFLNEEMMKFWKSIQRKKANVTELGHWSGTGMVDFSE